MNKSINVEKIDLQVSKFIKERDWDQFHSVKNLSMALSVEASELAELFQWLKEKESNEVSSNVNLKAKLKDEIADVFVYLLQIAKKSDINIEEAVLDKIKKNAKKYPIEKAKGSALKYDEF